MAIARADMVAEAEMYLEPPAGDGFGQKFEVTYTYNDGSTTQVDRLGGTHTSDSSKVENRGPPASRRPARRPRLRKISKTEVYLAD